MLDPNMGDQKRPDTMLEEMLNALDEQVGRATTHSSELRGVLRKLDNSMLSFEEPQPDGSDVQSSPSSHIELLGVLINHLAKANDRNQEIINNLQKIV